jgi:ribosomal protein S8
MKFTKKNFQILKLLKKLNLINKMLIFKKHSITYIKIYIYFFKTITIGSNFKIMSTPTKSFFISLKALKLLSKRTGNSIFLISNSYALADHFVTLKQKNGGMLIGFFSL